MLSRVAFILSLCASFLGTATQQVTTTTETSTTTDAAFFIYCHFEQGEYALEILSCNRCLPDSTSNFCSFYTQNNASVASPSSITSALSPAWYHSDLLQLITTNNVLTNLDDLSLFNGLASLLFTVQLNNMDIEEIRPGAFERFYSLKVLNLGNNRIKSVELASFSYLAAVQSWNQSTNETGIEVGSFSRSNKLVSIDLSYNQIGLVRMESLAVLNELLAFNLSNNFVDSFDLRFFAIIAPKLQVLDLGSNRLRSFKVFNDFLSSGVSGGDSFGSKPYSLIKNLIATDLISLSLEE